MDFVLDDETEGFLFIWTIQNFCYCLQQKGEPLLSPRFKLSLWDTNEWRLSLYPRGFEEDDTIGVFLRDQSRGEFPIKLNSCFSILSSDGAFLKRTNLDASLSFENGPSFGIKPCELFKKDFGFIENNKLTLCCRIWKEYPDLPVLGCCFARTVIDFERIAFPWTLDNFKELLHNGRKTIKFYALSSENLYFTVDIFVSGRIHDEKKIQVEIKQNEPHKISFLSCKLSLLDAEGKASQSADNEYWFGVSQETLNRQFTFVAVKKILEHEKLYSVNGELSLRCEFCVASGAKYSEIERTDYGVIQEHKAFYSNTMDESLSGFWNDNLQRFYEEGKLRDLTIRTSSSKEFPVHKAILCAQSEVFSAMFEHDTKENRTGVVEIYDFNDEVISKMLLFTYTGILDALDWEEATELYFAANKYGIVALKRGCADFLLENLNSFNVCAVLETADVCQDQVMKSAAQDFFMDNAAEIINTELWKQFIKDHSYLAADTMHLLCRRNLKI